LFRPSALKEKWDGAGESFGDVEMSVSDDSSITSSLSFVLKVSKFQKQIFLFSLEPKNERSFFLNSALASKMSQSKNEGTLVYQLGGI
jgi:hypothetical protein